MYVPSFNAATDRQLAALLGAAPFVDLVTPTADGLLATPLPVLVEPGRLLGHVARNNSHWSTPATGESLAIVHGPDAYVSPTWYAAKAEHGRVVPTWNYTIAHVYGRLVVHDDPAWVESLVDRLTDAYESGRTPQWSTADAPRPYIDGQLRAIVGVELVITRIQAKAKLSQNRSGADRAGVIAGLGPDDPVARAMSE